MSIATEAVPHTGPIVELVPPMDRKDLVELDFDDRSDCEVFVYLHPAEGNVFVNAEPKTEELGMPFWLKVLDRQKVNEVEKHPFAYFPGKVAVEAAYSSAS